MLKGLGAGLGLLIAPVVLASCGGVLPSSEDLKPKKSLQEWFDTTFALLTTTAGKKTPSSDTEGNSTSQEPTGLQNVVIAGRSGEYNPPLTDEVLNSDGSINPKIVVRGLSISPQQYLDIMYDSVVSSYSQELPIKVTEVEADITDTQNAGSSERATLSYMVYVPPVEARINERNNGVFRYHVLRDPKKGKWYNLNPTKSDASRYNLQTAMKILQGMLREKVNDGENSLPEGNELADSIKPVQVALHRPDRVEQLEGYVSDTLGVPLIVLLDEAVRGIVEISQQDLVNVVRQVARSVIEQAQKTGIVCTDFENTWNISVWVKDGKIVAVPLDTKFFYRNGERNLSSKQILEIVGDIVTGIASYCGPNMINGQILDGFDKAVIKDLIEGNLGVASDLLRAMLPPGVIEDRVMNSRVNQQMSEYIPANRSIETPPQLPLGSVPELPQTPLQLPPAATVISVPPNWEQSLKPGFYPASREQVMAEFLRLLILGVSQSNLNDLQPNIIQIPEGMSFLGIPRNPLTLDAILEKLNAESNKPQKVNEALLDAGEYLRKIGFLGSERVSKKFKNEVLFSFGDALKRAEPVGLPLVTMSYPGIIRGNSLLFFVKTEEDTIALYNSTVTSNESDEEKKELKTVKMAEFKKRDDDTWELLANRNIKTAMKPNENYDRLMSNQSLTWEELMQGGAIIPKSTPCSILAQELPIYPQGLVDRNGKRMVAVLVFDEETNSVRFQIRYQCPEE